MCAFVRSCIVFFFSWLRRAYTHVNVLSMHIFTIMFDRLQRLAAILIQIVSQRTVSSCYCAYACAHAHVDHTYWMSQVFFCTQTHFKSSMHTCVYVDQFRSHMQFQYHIYLFNHSANSAFFRYIATLPFDVIQCRCTEKFHHVMHNRQSPRTTTIINEYVLL